MNVAPSGFPKCRNFACGEVVEDESGEFAIEVFSRKSCVIAMPIDAKERDVRSQARKVRSMCHVSIVIFKCSHAHAQAERDERIVLTKRQMIPSNTPLIIQLYTAVLFPKRTPPPFLPLFHRCCFSLCTPRAVVYTRMAV